MTDNEDGSLLVVLLETHPNLWGALPPDATSPRLSASAFMQQVICFLNAFLLLSDGNRLAVYSVHTAISQLLYLSPTLQSTDKRQHATEPLASLLLGRIQALLQQQPGMQPGPALAGALSRALCLIRQHWGGAASEEAAKAQGHAPPRLLCISASADAASQYIPMMNAIFAAQKLGVVLDACMVGAADSSFLQQAAYITGGIYLRPPHPAALLQYLLTSFLPNPNTRKLLRLPPDRGIDFSASCFCHQLLALSQTAGVQKPIDMGYVCSVCLSIFCEEVDDCATCGTRFKSDP